MPHSLRFLTAPFLVLGFGTVGNTLTWDAAGNMTVANGASYAVNNNNQITSAGFGYNAEGDGTTVDGKTVAYDAQGRVASQNGLVASVWNAEG